MQREIRGIWIKQRDLMRLILTSLKAGNVVQDIVALLSESLTEASNVPTVVRMFRSAT